MYISKLFKRTLKWKWCRHCPRTLTVVMLACLLQDMFLFCSVTGYSIAGLIVNWRERWIWTLDNNGSWLFREKFGVKRTIKRNKVRFRLSFRSHLSFGLTTSYAGHMKLANERSSSSAGRMATCTQLRWRPLETSRTVVMPHPIVSSAVSVNVK